MQRLTMGEFAALVGGEIAPAHADAWIANISVDSRQIASETLFVALRGAHQDGHAFVADAFGTGAVAALVARNIASTLQFDLPRASPVPLLLVEDPLRALCRFATFCRSRFQGKVIAVTGSNGKTMVKNALHHIVSSVHSCSASPGSFNSQLGVALSLIRARTDAQFHIQEAGISEVGEMADLEAMIRPDFGLLTNIGWAHLTTLGSRANIASEKMTLFQRILESGWLLMPSDDPLVELASQSLPCRRFRWQSSATSELLPNLLAETPAPEGTRLLIRFPGGDTKPIVVGTQSPEAVQDVFIALCAAYLLNISPTTIAFALQNYAPAPTRRQTWKSPSGITVINDASTPEPFAIQSALRELPASGFSGQRFFVLDTTESRSIARAIPPEAANESAPIQNQEAIQSLQSEHAAIGRMAAEAGVNTLILVGDSTHSGIARSFRQHAPHQHLLHFAEMNAVRAHLLSTLRAGDTLLLMAFASLSIDRLAVTLLEAMAPNRFYVNLQAIEENIARFRRLMGPRVQLLAMVKALAYGSDATRLGLELQTMGVDKLGVSSVDEGISLRKSGVSLPILVMLCAPEEVEKLLRYELTPVLYSFTLFHALRSLLQREKREMAVHVEIDTGLGRGGFTPVELSTLLHTLHPSGPIHIQGLMTHLSAADDPDADDFTHLQIARFENALSSLDSAELSSLLIHAAATSGAIRFSEARYDMVRIGLGLYGLSPSPVVQNTLELVPAIALVSRIINIQMHQQGDRIGYNGTFVVPQNGFRKAVLPIGYHDGIPISASNQSFVLINGHKAPMCGRISMDSLTVDVTHIPDASVGMDALIYGAYGGHALRPEEFAQSAQTIVYELLARLGPRVQRIFVN